MSTTDLNLSIDEVETTVRRIAADVAGVKVECVSPNSSLELDLSFDSLDKVDFAMKLEETYELEIPDDEAAAVKTVNDAVILIRARRT